MSRYDQDDRRFRPALRRMAVLGAVFAATAAFAAAAVFALAARSSAPELVPGGQPPPPGAVRIRS
ncbi:MAG TPA: hypothetical protein VE309_05425 [Caulobacteraceae bacterium]|nr:hypothetical protein [Caulobacteraceae bacterium]